MLTIAIGRLSKAATYAKGSAPSCPCPKAPKSFISSKNAEYVSSIVTGFTTPVGRGAVGATWVGTVMTAFGFNLGTLSLLTRTEAGTWIQKKQLIISRFHVLAIHQDANYTHRAFKRNIT